MSLVITLSDFSVVVLATRNIRRTKISENATSITQKAIYNKKLCVMTFTSYSDVHYLYNYITYGIIKSKVTHIELL